MQNLQFDKTQHRYFLKGDSAKTLELPGVTRVLGDVGLWPDFSNVDPYYRDRGTRGHDAIFHIFDATLNRMDPSTPAARQREIIQKYIDSQDQDLQGFLQSFELWRTDDFWRPATMYFEHRIFSEALGVAGTLDWYGVMSYRDHAPGANQEIQHTESLLDFKFGQYHKQYALQTAGYKTILVDQGKPVGRRFCLCLDPDGNRPKLHPHDDFNDYDAFRAAVQVWHARQKLK